MMPILPDKDLNAHHILIAQHGVAAECIVEGLNQVRQANFTPPLAIRAAATARSRNQFCLFLKPWVTDPGADLRRVMDLVVRKINLRGLSIEQVAILPGWFLDRHKLMHQHYGRLNLLANGAAANLSDAMRMRFRDIFGTDATEQTVLGGFEFLKRFADISPFGLELLWENTKQHRLSSGAFCARVTVGNESIFIVNGFVPNLMRAYTRVESVVVVFSINGTLSWPDARSLLVGNSDPARAASGSLRNELFINQTKLGISELRLGANGIHLSAGPVEALVELRRFMSTVFLEQQSHVHFQFGQKLEDIFTGQEIDMILNNPSVRLEGMDQSIFDATEELDEETALKLLSTVRHQLFGGEVTTSLG